MNRFFSSVCCLVALTLAGCGGSGNAGPNEQSALPQGSSAVPAGPATQGFTQNVPDGATVLSPLTPDVSLVNLGRAHADLSAPIINDSGSYPGGPIIVGTNTGSAGTGVEGVTGAAGGYGLLGISQNTAATGANIGVFGKNTGPGGFGVYGYASQYVGVFGISRGAAGFGGYFLNTSTSTSTALRAVATGNGIIAQSSQGNGAVGQTSFPSNNGTFALQKAGLLGQDLSTDGGAYDAGVAGLSTSGYGVYGQTSSGQAVAGQAMTTGAGVYGFVLSGAPGGVGVAGNNFGSGTGNLGNGDGISAISRDAVAIVAEGLSTSPTTPVELVLANGGQPLFIGKNASTDASVVSIDAAGNAVLAGNLVVDGSITTTKYLKCAACTKPLAMPAEVTGEGQVVAGRGYVHLDPTDASQLDPSAHYLVFLTPEGDNKGLYVTDRTASGFAVHESMRGTSSLPFAYRIVGSARAGSAGTLRPIATHASAPQFRVRR